jgi:hypothetical protein
VTDRLFTAAELTDRLANPDAFLSRADLAMLGLPRGYRRVRCAEDASKARVLQTSVQTSRCIPVGHLDIAAWRCEHLDHVQVYAIIDGLSRPEHPLGAAVEVFIRREDAERFIDEVRGDEPELASCLRSSSASSRPAGGFRKELVSRLTNRNLRNRLPRPLLDRDPVTSRPSTSPARSSCRTTNPTATATRASRCGSR